MQDKGTEHLTPSELDILGLQPIESEPKKKTASETVGLMVGVTFLSIVTGTLIVSTVMICGWLVMSLGNLLFK